MSAPQTTYSVDVGLALPGQLADDAPATIVSYTCSEDIPPGRMVELVSGQVRLPKTATAVGTLVGLALYDATKEPYPALGASASGTAFGWKSGSVVPVLRKGRAWASYSGTATDALGVVRVRSASDDTNSEATHRGKVTASAASATAGSEIYTVASAAGVKNDGSAVALVEVNFP